jgi:hypothetical protein
MSAKPISTASKKNLVKSVGNDLVKHYGKKKYYSKAMVDASARRQNVSVDIECWAYCFFTAAHEFAEIHRVRGESCDYEAMRGSMASAVTDGHSESWFDADLSWLDWPDVDFFSWLD